MTDTTIDAPAPDTMISRFLPQLRGHIIGKYGWLESRGNCMITIDDLVQVASIALMRHAERWPSLAASAGVDPETNDGMFFVTLKEDVKRTIRDYRRKFEGLCDHDRRQGEECDPCGGYARPYSSSSFDDRPTIGGDELGNTEDEYRTAVNAPAMLPHWRMLQATIVDYYTLLRKREKMNIALRYFDELSHAATAELLGVGVATSRMTTTKVRAEWVTHARNQFTDYPVTLQDRVHGITWEPSDALVAYIQDRHRMDIDEYLGIVTIAFREDVSYLVEILSANSHYGADAHAAARILTPFQEAQVDKWLAKGMSMREISRDLGVAYHLITTYAKRGRTTSTRRCPVCGTTRITEGPTSSECNTCMHVWTPRHAA